MTGSPPESAVPDVLAPGLGVVFCGINPGHVSAAAAAHFANPRNDFWRLLHAAGFTPRLYRPEEQFELLELGIGLTNAAPRTTRGSGDLRRGDFAGAAERLETIAHELGPRVIAFVGKEAYRGAFGERPALGPQERRLQRDGTLRAPLHLTGQRGRSLGGAAAVVPRAERVQPVTEAHHGRALSCESDRRRGRSCVDDHGRVLLVRFAFPGDRIVWATVGGGLEPGETHEAAIRRELEEEVGLEDVDLGPEIWTRTHVWDGGVNWDGQTERYFLVRTPAVRAGASAIPGNS